MREDIATCLSFRLQMSEDIGDVFCHSGCRWGNEPITRLDTYNYTVHKQ